MPTLRPTGHRSASAPSLFLGALLGLSISFVSCTPTFSTSGTDGAAGMPTGHAASAQGDTSPANTGGLASASPRVARSRRDPSSPQLRSAGITPQLESGPLDGIALGLYSRDPEYDYGQLLVEIQRTGARWVSFVVNHYQETFDANVCGVPDERTCTPERLRTTIRQAHRLGLRVHLFPILLLQDSGGDHWRGTIVPTDREAWYASYRDWITSIAKLAEEEHVELLCMGSEFNSMQKDREEWLDILQSVRSTYGGPLLYSANWDSIDEVSFIDELDVIGMTSYFTLSDEDDPSIERMEASWWAVRADLVRWRRTHAKPIVFTEVGFPAQDGANKNPWNYFHSDDADIEEQRDCFEAFRRVWVDDPLLSGVFFYNWFGVGGPDDTGYTPRGKPALSVIERWFSERPTGIEPVRPTRSDRAREEAKTGDPR